MKFVELYILKTQDFDKESAQFLPQKLGIWISCISLNFGPPDNNPQ